MKSLSRSLALCAVALNVVIMVPGQASATGLSSSGSSQADYLPRPRALNPPTQTPVLPSTASDEQGWALVSFETHGDSSDRSFTVISDDPVRVSLTDTNCRGEAFAVSANQLTRAITPTVKSSPCPEDDSAQVVNNPWVAFVDQTYSHTTFVLPPGRYNIRVKAVLMPFAYGAGAAWLHFDSPALLPVCPQNPYACDQEN